MANNDKNSGSAIKLSDVEEVIRRNYRQELWQAVKACIGVHASLSLKGRDHCLVLILEGASGQGKSVAIRTLMPIKNHQSDHAFRVDEFTPAAFVSHAANVSKKKLKELHLLPKIKDKVMLSKELAPVFRGDEKEMRKNFATLTSVLDGDGYVKATGSQGTEGYVGRYLFNWIGATTPIPDHTHKIMSQLGNRILFFEVVSEEFSDEELLEFAKNYGANDAVKVCQEAVIKFIESYFKQRPVNS